MSFPNNIKLEITEPAKIDIKSIRQYTVDLWGKEQATKYTDNLYKTLENIHKDPVKGRERYGVPNTVKGRKSGKHVIFYRLEKNIIFIMRILHESMDHGRHLN